MLKRHICQVMAAMAEMGPNTEPGSNQHCHPRHSTLSQYRAPIVLQATPYPSSCPQLTLHDSAVHSHDIGCRLTQHAHMVAVSEANHPQQNRSTSFRRSRNNSSLRAASPTAPADGSNVRWLPPPPVRASTSLESSKST
jgi:hypothetical protein